MSPRAAIFVVNGGQQPRYGKWIDLLIAKLLEHPPGIPFTLKLWNHDPKEHERLQNHPPIGLELQLFQSEPGEEITHLHATPLQKMYEQIDPSEYSHLLVMDSDAHPIQDHWLSTMIDHTDWKGFGGVWRDELSDGITPYLHPSCLVIEHEIFIAGGYRMDYFEAPPKGERRGDTLSFLTQALRADGREPPKQPRSNKRNIHRLVSGLYGDLIYHHGAGSRKRISFHDEKGTLAQKIWNGELIGRATSCLFNSYQDYLDYLRGKETNNPKILSLVDFSETSPEDLPIPLKERLTYYLKNPRKFLFGS